MSNKPLLPLYIVHKQAYRLNEKNIIILLFAAVTVISLFVLFKSLPSNANDLSKVLINPIHTPRDSGGDVFKNKSASENIIEIKFRNEIKNNEINEINNPIVAHIENEKKSKAKKVEPKKTNEDSTVIERRSKVKEMAHLAWTSYKTYAWGHNELKPVSKTGHSPGIFGSNGGGLGATIVDSLDTLYIMGFMEDYEEAKDWVSKNLDLNRNSDLSVFEVNIRFIGGLLSMHSLTNDKMFLDKAEEIAQIILPTFDSPTGLPYSLYNPKTKHKQNYGWASSSCSILAELGTLSLEFQYLTDATGKTIYKEKIDKIFEVLKSADKPEGLYYNYINPNTGQWCTKQATLGALSDSFYEYLLKLWIYKDKRDSNLLNIYLNTMKSVEEKLIRKSNSGLTYVGETNEASVLVQKMGHLACFSGGLFALTSQYVDSLGETEKENYQRLAKEITHTCHESYIKTATHLGPEAFHFSGVEAVALNENEKYYILRPEVVESYFYLWRMTKDQKYRDWAWDMVLALEKFCRTDTGYQGIKNVYLLDAGKDDVQQSFFIAETLKYLFLIFSDDDVIPLDKYVFNTEAHPFLIRKN